VISSHFHVRCLRNYTSTSTVTETIYKKLHESFNYVHCRWRWRHFKVIRLFHIKFLVNGALYIKSYYRLLISRTLAFDWCHFWWPWRTFEGHFSDTSNFSGIAKASCPSVCLSVRLSVTLRYRDHIGWKSAKIIWRLISLTISLSTDPNMMDLLQREHP